MVQVKTPYRFFSPKPFHHFAPTKNAPSRQPSRHRCPAKNGPKIRLSAPMTSSATIEVMLGWLGWLGCLLKIRYCGVNGGTIRIEMVEVRFQECSPADGTNAAVNWRDYGRSRWQLSDKITTIAGVHVRGRSTYFAAREAGSVQVFGRRHSRCQPRAPAAGVRKAPRHGLGTAVVPQLWGFRRGLRRRCGGTWRQRGQFCAADGRDVHNFCVVVRALHKRGFHVLPHL
jgi:hypothetical protein